MRLFQENPAPILRVCSSRDLSPRMGSVVKSQGRQPLGAFRRLPLGEPRRGDRHPGRPCGAAGKRGGARRSAVHQGLTPLALDHRPSGALGTDSIRNARRPGFIPLGLMSRLPVRFGWCPVSGWGLPAGAIRDPVQSRDCAIPGSLLAECRIKPLCSSLFAMVWIHPGCARDGFEESRRPEQP